jgi:hypothetical protein
MLQEINLWPSLTISSLIFLTNAHLSVPVLMVMGCPCGGFPLVAAGDCSCQEIIPKFNFPNLSLEKLLSGLNSKKG